ncbi:MAG: DNA repair protein RecO [Oscillospiraceae bacterium]|nr:DNA repair protein RecO [Oscillospiraceae bacterium]
MMLTTEALVLREGRPSGEADRLVTLLTRERGVLRAYANGARSIKSRRAAGTQALCHTRLTLRQKGEWWQVSEAEALHTFFELRGGIEKLALAQYLCELAGTVIPSEEPAEDALRLMLGALHLLCGEKYTLAHIKAVTELRLLALSGLMPAFDGGGGRLELVRGTFGNEGWPVNDGMRAAMRFACEAPLERCFAFSTDDAALAVVAEAYLQVQLGRNFATLEFYHSVI